MTTLRPFTADDMFKFNNVFASLLDFLKPIFTLDSETSTR